VDLYPAQRGIHANAAYYLFLKGDVAGALLEIEKEPEESDRLFDRVLFLDALGRRPEADADFAVFIKKNAAVTPYSIASTYARRGEAEHAFEWLERAYRQHDDDLPGLKNSLGFKGLRADPRYKAMLRKMNLPE
jgi:tetratricopeptide (TPR) repeat protein